MIKNELENQYRMTHILDQLLNHYFNTFKFIAEFSAIQSEFNPKLNENDKKILYKKISSDYAAKIAKKEGIVNILTDPRNSREILLNKDNISENLSNWQLFKGLPDKNGMGNLIARDRREFSKNILKIFPQINYVFHVNADGDLLFIEPYEVQKNVTIFNYLFRDSLRRAILNKKTSISEVYISNDQNHTQSISVLTPIFDAEHRVSSIFGISIATITISNYVFNTLIHNLNINDKTVFYLLDRHGHVVASSSGENIYFPSTINDDNNDKGNLRGLKIFQEIKWKHDFFEKGGLWQRKTMSWDESSLKNIYQLQYKNFNGEEVIGTFYPVSLDGNDINWGVLIETPLSQLLASAEGFKKAFYFSGGLLTLVLLFLFIITIRNLKKLEFNILEKEKEIVNLSRQVAHDIRSPLAAINIAISDVMTIPENKRILIRSAAKRINDIANNMLFISKKNDQEIKNSNNNLKVEPELIYVVLDSIVSEKRYEYSNLPIKINLIVSEGSDICFAEINLTSFKRTLSNLINNSCEAIKSEGIINLRLSHDCTCVKIVIDDNGCGIPQNLLQKITDYGFSFGKTNGAGIGLSYAKQQVEVLNGQISIESKINVGTSVSIKLKQCNSPRWFCEILNIKINSRIVIVDDDQSIHDAWYERLKNISVNKVVHFLNASELTETADLQNSFFLIDYEFIGNNVNGIDIIEKFNLRKKAVLVTSYFEDLCVRKKCEEMNIKMLPKLCISTVPINTFQTTFEK